MIDFGGIQGRDDAVEFDGRAFLAIDFIDDAREGELQMHRHAAAFDEARAMRGFADAAALHWLHVLDRAGGGVEIPEEAAANEHDDDEPEDGLKHLIRIL